MKILALFACLAALGATPAANSQNNSADWTGVWQATLEGQPGMVLTLSDDSGELGGTVVFNGLSQETHTIVATETHLLLHPHLDAGTLTFQIKKHGNEMNTGTRSFTLVFTSTGKLQSRCTDCGPDSPATELTRITYPRR